MTDKIRKLFERFMELVNGSGVPALTAMAIMLFTVSAGAVVSPDRLTQKPRASIGAGVSQDSELIFDVGLGASNPKFKYKLSDTSLEFNKGILRFGTGTATDQILELNIGSGSTNPKFKWDNGSSKLRFSNDGTTYFDIPTTSGSTPNVTVKTANYTAACNDIVLANATGGAFNVTLPSATSGCIVHVQKTDTSANRVTVVGTINGVSNTKLNSKFEYSGFVADGSAWHIQYREEDMRRVTARLNCLSGPPPAGTCTILQNDGGWIVTAIRNSQGNFTLTFDTATFTAEPNCQCTIIDNSQEKNCQFLSNSSTAVTVGVDNNGTSSDRDFYIACQGPRS